MPVRTDPHSTLSSESSWYASRFFLSRYSLLFTLAEWSKMIETGQFPLFKRSFLDSNATKSSYVLLFAFYHAWTITFITHYVSTWHLPSPQTAPQDKPAQNSQTSFSLSLFSLSYFFRTILISSLTAISYCSNSPQFCF